MTMSTIAAIRHPYHEGCTGLYVNNEGMFCSCACHRTAPTTGAEYFERTGETAAQRTIREGVDNPDHRSDVARLGILITNTSPGYRASDGASAAVRVYRAAGLEGVLAIYEKRC